MKNRKILWILILLSLGLWGCGKLLNENGILDTKQNTNNKTTESLPLDDEPFFSDSKAIAECYQKVYTQAVNDGTLGTFDVVQKIVKFLGDAGYTAVDDANQVNMVNSEQAKKFINKVKEKADAKSTIVSVSNNGCFTKFDLQTSKGEVFVIRSYISWNGEVPEITSKEEYNAYSFCYTEEGYLFFQKYQMPGYDGPTGYTALRVEYLDEKCRELNRQYLLSIGYGSNNMFITEWNEDDFGKLNFYDLFHILYPLVYKKQTPYDVSYQGKLYDVPQEEFEKVIMSHFKIDRPTLQNKTTYLKQNKVYQYRTRGFNDWGWDPNTPYPEVEHFEKNADGTLKLIVNVVYPAKSISCAFSHEVIIRPLSDGRVQYMSNHIIPSNTNIDPIWYTEKFSDEEWNGLYEE